MMRTFLKVLSSEWLKMRKSNIWLLIFISPAISAFTGLLLPLDETLPPWLYLFTMTASLHAFMFLPLLTGVFAAFVCRYEHAAGGWKQLLTLPLSRGTLYTAKFFVVILLLALTQLLYLLVLLAAGYARGIGEAFPWELIGPGIFAGWVATLPLAALQMFVSTAWASFAAPLAINVIFTIPNMLIVNSSTYGPYYPWAQPVLSMLSVSPDKYGAFNVSLETLLFVIVGGFVLFFLSGLTYFRYKEV
ncbi:Uncharacterized protein conserved in bacteria [Chlamydia abortus]|nr:Uncharacterized protein conserved in bacteria [Chlamydia abortus]